MLKHKAYPLFLFIADLEKQLLESERLLGEISVVSRQETPNIASMARNMEAMELTTDEMEVELRRLVWMNVRTGCFVYLSTKMYVVGSQ